MPWKDVAGYQIMMQAHDFSCGMACVAMFVNRVDFSKPAESIVISASKRVGGGSYTPAFKDRGMMQGTGMRMLTATTPVRESPDAGTYMENLANILTQWKIPAVVRQGSALTSIQAARSGSPVIAQVEWSGGGGSHFVLVEKFEPGAPKGLIICDPAYGLCAQTLSTTYSPQDGVSGTFINWTVTRRR